MSSFDKFEETLTKLSDIQKQAVLSNARSLQIVAGPGSGKTRVLTMRVAQLVARKNIEPCNILAVTFTKKAANEMIERLNVLIGKDQTSQLLIGTFHSICNKLLRAFGGKVGLKGGFVIIDTNESKKIMTDLLKDKTLVLNNYAEGIVPAKILKIISKQINKGVTARDYAESVNGNTYKQDISEIYTRYEEELKKNNLVDFDNLLLKGCQVLRIKRDALSNIEAVLVDEYQDTNIIQYELLLNLDLQLNNRSLTIVGDPDQSIFGWRHAEPANFRKMREDFEDTQIINMEQNFRSSSTILKSAYHVITQDKKRHDKNLYTNNPAGVPISFIDTPNEETQAEFVAAEIKRVIKYSKGLITFKDIAVLMRMNYISQKFEHTFRKHKIPYTVAKGDRFFRRTVIQDILGYLRFAYNPSDKSSLKRIINVPKRGVGDVNFKKIIDYAIKEKVNYLEALQQIVIEKKIGNRYAQMCAKLAEFHMIIMEVKEQIDNNANIAEVLEYIIETVEYDAHLQHIHYKNKERYQEELANIGELVILAKKFSSKDEEDIDSSFYVSSQQPNSQKQHSTSKDEDEDDIFEVKEEPVEDVQDFTTQTSENDDAQGFDSQDVIFTQTQKYEPADVINEAFQKDFDVDDEPVYDTPKTIIQEFLEYCSLGSEEKEVETTEEGKVTIATMHASKGFHNCISVIQ